MKEQLSPEAISALVAYRLQRAHETIEEVPQLQACGYYNTAVNRLYYASYYAVVALLLRYNITATTHAGVRQMLGMHFIATNLLSREHNRLFNQLFERRHNCDYDDFAYSTSEEIAELLPKAIVFLEAIEALLQNSSPR